MVGKTTPWLPKVLSARAAGNGQWVEQVKQASGLLFGQWLEFHAFLSHFEFGTYSNWYIPSVHKPFMVQNGSKWYIPSILNLWIWRASPIFRHPPSTTDQSVWFTGRHGGSSHHHTMDPFEEKPDGFPHFSDANTGFFLTRMELVVNFKSEKVFATNATADSWIFVVFQGHVSSRIVSPRCTRRRSSFYRQFPSLLVSRYHPWTNSRRLAGEENVVEKTWWKTQDVCCFARRFFPRIFPWIHGAITKAESMTHKCRAEHLLGMTLKSSYVGGIAYWVVLYRICI